MQVRSAGLSDVGRVRQQNEDSWLINEDLGLYVVADGMGGHQGGQVASAMAVEHTLAAVVGYKSQIETAGESGDVQAIAAYLSSAIREASAAIYARSRDDSDLHGMGTTVTALLLVGKQAFVAHVGDSRCYLLRGETIVQLTEDHSLVNEQIRAGLMTEEEGRYSRLKNIITRSVGFERDVAVDTVALELEAGDRLALCSDGLSNLVEDAEIGYLLRQTSIEQAPEVLIALANERGGDDNSTVVCLAIEG